MERKWTDEELHVLRSRFAMKGARSLAHALGRPVDGVLWKARKEGLSLGEIDGWVPIKNIAKATGLHPNGIRQRAIATGVARKLVCDVTGRTLVVIVPEAWAEAYIRATKRKQEADELVGHYYTVDQAARIFGVHHTTLRSWLYGEPEGSPGPFHIANVKIAITSNNRILLNPWQVEQEARRFREGDHRY